nr:protein FAM207A isoform X3 [Globicephala melas]
MGKVRGLRSRVHKAAVRPTGEAAPGPTPPAREAASLQASAGGVGGKEWAFMNASVFAGTTIDPSALVQKLDVDARSSASVRRGAKTKAVLPKKEKLKLRRERWLQMAGTFAVLLEGVRIGPSLHGLRTGPWSVSCEPALLRVSRCGPGSEEKMARMAGPSGIWPALLGSTQKHRFPPIRIPTRVQHPTRQ